MPAFQDAYDRGYRYFETDVFASKDNQVVINHGAKRPLEFIDRSGYSNRHLETLTYNQIKTKYRVSGQPMPLLSDVLQTFPKVKIFIDPKTDKVVEPLAELIKGLRAINRVCVGSFNYKRTEDFALLIGGWDKVSTSFISWALYRRIRYQFEGQCLQLPYWRLSAEIVDKIHQNGLRVITWGPSEEQGIINSIDYGVDGIMSNNVDILNPVIKDYKKLKPEAIHYKRQG